MCPPWAAAKKNTYPSVLPPFSTDLSKHFSVIPTGLPRGWGLIAQLTTPPFGNSPVCAASTISLLYAQWLARKQFFTFRFTNPCMQIYVVDCQHVLATTATPTNALYDKFLPYLSPTVSINGLTNCRYLDNSNNYTRILPSVYNLVYTATTTQVS